MPPAGALCRGEVGDDEAVWQRLAEEWSDARRKLDEFLPEDVGSAVEYTDLRAMIRVSLRRLPRPKPVRP